MVTKVYLIRHGETVDSNSRRYKGHIDVPLSQNGIEQINRVADYLVKNAKIDVVYCSDLSRAMRSAEIIAAPFGLTPKVHDGLKERNFGAWEGMTFDEIKEKWPDAFKSWARDPVAFSPLQGESTRAVRNRAIPAFRNITARYTNKTIALVAHGGINRVILCELLGIPLENIFRVEQDFAAINEIELWDYPVVKKFNYVVER